MLEDGFSKELCETLGFHSVRGLVGDKHFGFGGAPSEKTFLPRWPQAVAMEPDEAWPG